MAQFIAELKRRHVFRVAAAYLVVGWALVEVADTIAPMMALPPTAPRFVLFLVIILFPVALFMAWAFDIQPTDGSGAAAHSAAKAFIPVGGSVVALAAVSFALLFSRGDVPQPSVASRASSETPETGPRPAVSLAVLPFADLSPEGDQEYFGDGIAEAIRNVLAPLDDLSVASSTSAFAFKRSDRNIREIGELLNVSYVLEGSVRKAGAQVAITAQLIDAESDRYVWSQAYERELTAANLFTVQEQIANGILAALASELDLNVQADITIASGTENLDAYDLYLQARQLGQISSTENVRRQVALAEQAVALDPDFAEAWALLARTLNWLPTWDQSLDHASYNRRAIEAAERALDLDSSNQMAYSALADAHYKLHEWERADEVLRQAEPDTRFTLVYEVMGLGYLSEANEMGRIMAVREPDVGFHHLMQALYLDAMGQPEAAVSQYELAILEGYNGGAEWNLALVHLRQGRSSVWTAIWARELLATDPELLPVLPYFREVLTAAPERRPQAALRLRAAVRELGLRISDLVARGPRFGLRVPAEIAVALGESEAVAEGFWSNSLKMWMWIPSLRQFRQSEAFRERVRESGMLAYWQAHGWPDLCRPVGEDDFACD